MSVSETNWGVPGSKHHTPAEVDEHAIISSVHGKKVFSVGSDGDLPITANYVLFDADDSAPDYIGVNDDADALTSATDWTVYKFVYSGDNVTSIRKKTGTWDGRVALFS